MHVCNVRENSLCYKQLHCARRGLSLTVSLTDSVYFALGGVWAMAKGDDGQGAVVVPHSALDLSS